MAVRETESRVRCFEIAIVVAGALLLTLNAAVFANRLVSVLQTYPLFITEGGEGPHIYAIWRLIHGFPLYEWPHREPYSLTFYNFLFYHGYAETLKAIGADGTSILLYGRLITVGLGVAGAGFYAAFLTSLPGSSSTGLKTLWVAGGLALFVWFGSNFTSWWVLSIRPDIPAALFALLGFWSVNRAVARHSGSPLVLASLLFFLAWTFKQSVVLLFAGSAGYLFVRRDAPSVVRLVLPFGLMAGITLVLGSDAFRFNLLAAPLASGFSLSRGLKLFLRVLPQNALVWLLPIIGAWLERGAGPGSGREGRRLLLVTTAVAFLGGFVALTREGANENHLLEAYLAASVACWVTVSHLRVRLTERQMRTALTGALVLMAPMVAFPAAQLIWPNRVGVVRLATEEAYQAKAALADRLRELPKPVFIVDDILAQPWHATDGAYPALVLDPIWMDIASRHGVIQKSVAASLIRQGVFRSVVTPQGSLYHRAATDVDLHCGQFDGCPLCDRSLVACVP